MDYLERRTKYIKEAINLERVRDYISSYLGESINVEANVHLEYVKNYLTKKLIQYDNLLS